MFNTVLLFRIIRTGFVNFWRNIWLSAAATSVMIVTLVILSTLALIFVTTNYAVSTIRERVDISAYFKVGTSESQVLEIKSELERDPRIREVTYVSAEQALRDFRSIHEQDELITSSLDELTDNPLPPTLQIKATNLEDYPAINEELQSSQFNNLIDKVNFEDNRIVIERLNQILRFIVIFGIITTIIFTLIAILVIFNTITLTIFNRREEVEIMRLVGATNSYIRGPFMVEAAIYSVAATIITTLALVPLILYLPAIFNYISRGHGNDSLLLVTPSWIYYLVQNYVQKIVLDGQVGINIAMLMLGQLIIALFLSIVSTMLAMRKYLKI